MNCTGPCGNKVVTSESISRLIQGSWGDGDHGAIPSPPPISRFSTSSTEFLNSAAQRFLQDDDTSQMVHQKGGIYDLVQEKLKSIPFRNVFSHKWGNHGQDAELEADLKVSLLLLVDSTL